MYATPAQAKGLVLNTLFDDNLPDTFTPTPCACAGWSTTC